MRDQIEIVQPSYRIHLDLYLGLRGHKGAFTRVQKVIMIWRQFMSLPEQAVTEVVKATFGRDAELIYIDC